MKRRRRNWQLVYQHVTRADALCTLSAIEEANARVEELLSEESRERHSVSGALWGGTIHAAAKEATVEPAAASGEQGRSLGQRCG